MQQNLYPQINHYWIGAVPCLDSRYLTKWSHYYDGTINGPTREDAARISFLIPIPAIAGPPTIKLWDLQHTKTTPDWLMLGMATIVAGLSAYFCIVILLNIEKKSDTYHLLSTDLAWVAYYSG